MTLKLKQSKNSIKQGLLPPILNFHPNRYSLKQSNTNRSLPRIICEIFDQAKSPINAYKSKGVSVNRPNINDKLKAIYQKINKNQLKSIRQQKKDKDNQVDESNITNNFRKQIDKNLRIIKREKENHRNKKIHTTNQCISQRNLDTPKSQQISMNKQLKSYTEEDVFTKINQIILKSQSISKKQEKSSYNSSMMANKSYEHPEQYRQQHSKVLKTQGYQSEKAYTNIYGKKSKPTIKCKLKHDGNYNEWRKLSISSGNKETVSYQMSSYDLETDRLQNIRHKNDLSLKKYFQEKSYLQRLIKSRQSQVLLSKKL